MVLRIKFNYLVSSFDSCPGVLVSNFFLTKKFRNVISKTEGKIEKEVVQKMKIHVKCEGVTPILFNPKTDEVIAQLMKSKSARKQVSSETNPDEIAEKKIPRDDKGRAGVPGRYLFGNLSEAGRDVQLEARKKLSTREQTFLPSFLRIVENFMPFCEGYIGKNGWVTDKDMGRPDPKLPTMPIIRPRFEKWSFEMTLDVFSDIAIEKIKELVEKGGRLGLGAFRKKGPYGRYKVVEWRVEGEEESKTEEKKTGRKNKTKSN